MNRLQEILAAKKNLIVGKWVDEILATYPRESSRFLKSQKDRFANPIGYTVSKSAEKLFDELIGENDKTEIRLALDDLMRLRAVQSFSPSEAVAIIFYLKGAIREGLKEEIAEDSSVYAGLIDTESRIDSMALVAFDVYMEARERLFKIRIEEVKARSLQAMTEGTR